MVQVGPEVLWPQNYIAMLDVFARVYEFIYCRPPTPCSFLCDCCAYNAAAVAWVWTVDMRPEDHCQGCGDAVALACTCRGAMATYRPRHATAFRKPPSVRVWPLVATTAAEVARRELDEQSARRELGEQSARRELGEQSRIHAIQLPPVPAVLRLAASIEPPAPPSDMRCWSQWTPTVFHSPVCPPADPEYVSPPLPPYNS